MISDAQARRRGATDFDTNLLVEAGAGTGKTSLLVERVLNALGSQVCLMGGIAAITFTEKAAGEMRRRLALELERLRAIARAELPVDDASEAGRAFAHLRRQDHAAEQIAARALAALEQLDQATVTTLHQLCSQLLRDHPQQAGVDPGFVIDEGKHDESLGHEAWEAYLAAELGPAGARPDVWARLLAKVDLESLGALARSATGFDVPLECLDPGHGREAVARLLDAEARSLSRTLAAFVERAVGMSPATTAWFEAARRALAALEQAGLPGLRRHLEQDPPLRTRLESKDAPKANTLLSGVSAAELERTAKETFDFLRTLHLADDDTVAGLLDLVRPFVEQFREQFLRRGFVGFDGLLVLARNLLVRHRDVRRRLQQRYRQLLVDEFQDTDPLMYEIVLLLAQHEDDPAADAYAARLAPGRLFVVGDAKQSIYRFRRADYAAYRRAVERILTEGGERLLLTANHRSTHDVLDPVNRIFHPPLWEASPYQPPYEPVAAARGAAADRPGVELWSVELPDGTRAGDRREAEGRLIAAEIERLVAEQECCYDEIAILFRAFAPIAHYLRPLRERGIPFVVDGGKEFLDRPEVAQLMALLRTLSQPADEVALLAYLRSPAGAVPDTALAAFAASGGRWDWRQPAAPAHAQIAACFAFLRELARKIRRLPADAAIRAVLRESNLGPFGAAAFEGAQRVANLRKLSTAAAELAGDGKLSLEQVEEALRDGRRIDLVTDAPLADDAAEAVRITSIHRMKGLESRWLFVPDLAREDMVGPGRAPLRLSYDDAGTPLLALKAGGLHSSSWAWFARDHQRHDAAEEVRVLYVALTRARDRAILVAGPPPARGSARGLEALRAWGYDAAAPPADGETLADGRVLHRCRRAPPRPRASERQQPVDERAAVARYAAVRERLSETARPTFVSPSGLDDEPVGTGAGSRDLGKASGIAIHRLLQQWTRAPLADPSRRLAELCAELAPQLAVERAELEREAGEILAAFLGSELSDWLSKIRPLDRELPLLLRRDDGSILRGTLDLLYQDPRGGLVVADYKTDRDADDEALRRRYGAQLAAYAAAVQEANGLLLPPRRELWLLRHGRRLELE
ncbi:MAG TPA: UvrD-helicase domain-containing protein [Candidatus Polarisedimenticolaceae bacterium]|nr:UvrD-helicase domain-containing protein [Candidatus Polarisedimenticolaceae bacterium]